MSMSCAVTGKTATMTEDVDPDNFDLVSDQPIYPFDLA